MIDKMALPLSLAVLTMELQAAYLSAPHSAEKRLVILRKTTQGVL